MNKLTASPDFVIRTPETAGEIASYFRLSVETFHPDDLGDPLPPRLS